MPAFALDHNGHSATLEVERNFIDFAIVARRLQSFVQFSILEHGDVQHPYVLGSLWNAHEAPGDLVHTDGSYALHTEQQIAMAADKAISITGKDTLKLESSGDMTINTDGKIKQSASWELSISGMTIKIESNSTLTIKGTSITIDGQMVEVKGMVQLG